MALLITLGLAFSYGFWFYTVEVEIYVPPLLFLLTSAWLLNRALKGQNDSLFRLVGASQAVAALIHRGSLLIIPAFVFGILFMPGSRIRRALAVLRYLMALGIVIGPAYLAARVVIAGQTTPADFMRWVIHYGSLGTWGAWRNDSMDAVVSGLSAAVSAKFWTGRVVSRRSVRLRSGAGRAHRKEGAGFRGVLVDLVGDLRCVLRVVAAREP